MSYYNRYRNRKRQDAKGDGAGGAGGAGAPGGAPGGMPGLQTPDAIFDLGKNKRVTVRQFRNINLIDIREYYLDQSSGEMRPGKKGISLTEDLYDELLRHRLNIDEALRRFGSRRPRTKTVRLLSDDEDDDAGEKPEGKGKQAAGGAGAQGAGAQASKDAKGKKSAEKAGSSGTATATTTGATAKRERHYDEDNDENNQKKKKPAPPTLLPHEENIENAKREANATLIIPGMKRDAEAGKPEKQGAEKPEKQETAPAAAAAAAPAPVTAPGDDNSSDEEFAESLQAEMDKINDESSEEE
ncbi:chromatin-binding transcription coactivator SUB1 KNAG_0M02330 [Huiozyma naganishii CBS 8797]|uniref:Transcriptional coactivator p15 (PC4) C-terminal domain-containing protein n=1 Tax=Huiozyma naganishii (strain ATCC MYA-139 / BCRC 22969 / CBS 8797 / KCTC 17520 / NBRC 10181 / NCYC 3082 / Yp74L-3) TaxID=1071383 RepID=J7SBJ1_HUIN7|nr:hypothetical protein KNAG_0M02330 [Kazachstania naganishii CBS 8797]CCK73086.1 hypothetical protein KNAG_0M02330 [Kazachstania naganishii CBS 8797]